MSKKTMTLNLRNDEMKSLIDLSNKHGVSKTHIIRQALRIYHLVDDRIDKGHKIKIDDTEIIVI